MLNVSKPLNSLKNYKTKVYLSWAVHIFTTTGTLCAMSSMINILNGQPAQALVWLMVAQVIDGVDGPMARYINVKKYTPVIDGNLLDLVVDYVTCVIAPILFAVKFDMLPERFEVILSSLVIMTSAIWFSRKDIETKDMWFRGFPTAWNLVVTVLWLIGTSQNINVGIFIAFIILTMMPAAKFAHLLSAPQFRKTTVTLSIIAMITMVYMTVIAQHRHGHFGKLIIVSWAAYYLSISIWRSLQGDEITD